MLPCGLPESPPHTSPLLHVQTIAPTKAPTLAPTSPTVLPTRVPTAPTTAPTVATQSPTTVSICHMRVPAEAGSRSSMQASHAPASLQLVQRICTVVHVYVSVL